MPTSAEPGFTKKDMIGLLSQIMSQAGSEAPTFAVMNIRDWWYLKRGPRWRFPLPERRVFKPLPQRNPLVRMLRRDGRIELQDDARRAFVPSIFIRAYTAYATLPAWVNGSQHRGRTQRRRFRPRADD
jgi:hypothetical protein